VQSTVWLSWLDRQPVFLIGSSMGGNFVLRLGIRHGTHPIPNLALVVAVNPAIHPQHSTSVVDERGTYRRFFRRRWLRSLLMKQRLFPGTSTTFRPREDAKNHGDDRIRRAALQPDTRRE